LNLFSIGVQLSIFSNVYQTLSVRSFNKRIAMVKNNAKKTLTEK